MGRQFKPGEQLNLKISALAAEALELLRRKWKLNKTESVERALLRAAARFAKPKVEE